MFRASATFVSLAALASLAAAMPAATTVETTVTATVTAAPAASTACAQTCSTGPIQCCDSTITVRRNPLTLISRLLTPVRDWFVVLVSARRTDLGTARNHHRRHRPSAWAELQPNHGRRPRFRQRVYRERCVLPEQQRREYFFLFESDGAWCSPGSFRVASFPSVAFLSSFRVEDSVMGVAGTMWALYRLYQL